MVAERHVDCRVKRHTLENEVFDESLYSTSKHGYDHGEMDNSLPGTASVHWFGWPGLWIIWIRIFKRIFKHREGIENASKTRF